jgi:hypothetical protein
MKRKMLLRLCALPFVAAMGALPGLAGCDVVGDATCPEWGDDYGASLGADIDANVKAFVTASGRLEVLANDMVAKVSVSCSNIAVAAGRDKSKWAGKEGADLVNAACGEASAGIDAVLAAAGNVSIEFGIEGGGCAADLKATADCYAKCDVEGKCTPAELEAQCEPGKLSGSCSGQCDGSCSVDGGSVQCTGTCGATCKGTCGGDCVGRCDGADSTGQCAGQCDGRCEGECKGTCSGSCDYTAPSAQCEGTCHGSCSVEYQAPKCEGKITGPECDIDAKCEANCKAEIQAKLVCEPPKVTWKVIGTGTAQLQTLATALEANLPDLILYGTSRGDALVDIAGELEASVDGAVSAAADNVKAAACVALAAEAAVSAVANVKASVSVSVEVSASASASAK